MTAPTPRATTSPTSATTSAAAAPSGWPRRGGRVAGFIALAASHVDQLYVDPPRQSSGVGGALLDHAKAISPGGLTLTVAPRNAAARRFYERHGFVAIETENLRDRDDDAPAGEEGEVLYAWRA